MSQLSTRHLLGIKDITETDIRLILETTTNFKEVINRPIKKKSLPFATLPLPIFFSKTPPGHACPSSSQRKG